MTYAVLAAAWLLAALCRLPAVCRCSVDGALLRRHARGSEQRRRQSEQESQHQVGQLLVQQQSLGSQLSVVEAQLRRAERELAYTNCLIPVDRLVALYFPYLAGVWFALRQRVCCGVVGAKDILAAFVPPQPGSVIAGAPGVVVYWAVLPLLAEIVERVVGEAGLNAQPLVFVCERGR